MQVGCGRNNCGAVEHITSYNLTEYTMTRASIEPGFPAALPPRDWLWLCVNVVSVSACVWGGHTDRAAGCECLQLQ